MDWTAERERRAIVEHVSRCSFCRALLAQSRRRHNRELLTKAEDLAWQHTENDREREDFEQRCAVAILNRRP